VGYASRKTRFGQKTPFVFSVQAASLSHCAGWCSAAEIPAAQGKVRFHPSIPTARGQPVAAQAEPENLILPARRRSSLSPKRELLAEKAHIAVETA